ncbi:MAG: cystathionine gamma-synthase [Gemmatimonadota bacterium]
MPAETTSLATRAVRAGIGSDTQHGAVVPPIYLTSTFGFDGLGGKRQYDYTRSGNPGRDQLAEVLADLEGGVGAVVTGTGMSAVTLVVQLVQPGELILAAHDCYGGTHRLLTHLARRGHLRVEFIDFTCPSAASLIVHKRPRLVWIETPSNPLLRITDLRTVSVASRAVGALVVADNTFLSPVFQQPISLGADLVVHSTTKYLNGHSDIVGGAVVAARADLLDELRWWANCLGLTGAPFDAYLTLRGIRTLHARMRQHEENATRVVQFLLESAVIERVHYPGLAHHPGHEVAARQQQGFGGMVSCELRGGLPAVRAFVDGLESFSLAESLGGVESLVAHPATMTHASMDPAARARAGITDGLVRLSVGIESAADLVADLDRALDRASIATLERTAAWAVAEQACD